MTDRELTGKVHSAVYHQCQRRGYAAPVDVLMEIGVLPKEKYEDWRRGRIDYLERVCTVNLRKLSFIMREIRAYAQKSGLKPSVTVYKQWAVKKKSGQGHKPVIRLRFSKSGDPDIERWYSTHFVDAKKIAELKAQRMTELLLPEEYIKMFLSHLREDRITRGKAQCLLAVGVPLDMRQLAYPSRGYYSRYSLRLACHMLPIYT